MRPEDDLEEWSEVLESSSWELKIQLEEPVEEVNEITGFLEKEACAEACAEARAEAAWAAAAAPSTWPWWPPMAVALISPASLEVVEPDLLVVP